MGGWITPIRDLPFHRRHTTILPFPFRKTRSTQPATTTPPRRAALIARLSRLTRLLFPWCRVLSFLFICIPYQRAARARSYYTYMAVRVRRLTLLGEFAGDILCVDCAAALRAVWLTCDGQVKSLIFSYTIVWEVQVSGVLELKGGDSWGWNKILIDSK